MRSALTAWLTITALAAPIAEDVHHAGDIVDGTLPVAIENGRNAAKLGYAFAVEPGKTVTVQVDSLDFDAIVTVTRAGTELTDRESGPLTNPWLVVATEQSSELTVRVGAEDARGGEFRVTVGAGAQAPPSGLDALRADRAACVAIAERAESRGERARAREHWFIAGRIAYSTLDYAEAENPWQSVLRLAGDDAREARLEAELMLGAVHRGLGDLARAARELAASQRSLEEFALAAVDERTRQLASQWLAVLHENLGDIERVQRGAKAAIAHYREAAEESSRSGRRDFETTSWSRLAQVLEESGDSNAAEEAVEKSLASARASGKPNLIGEALTGKARFLLHRGRPDEARSAALTALELEKRPWIRSELIGTLAAACRELARYDEALARLDELEELTRASASEDAAIPVHIERGAIAWDLRDLEAARFELEAALEIVERSGANDQRAALLVDLARVLAEQGEASVSRERLEQAIEAAQATGDRTVEARAWQCLGKQSEDRRELGAALNAYERVTAIGKAADDAFAVGLGKTGAAYARWLGGNVDAARALATEAVAILEPLGWHEQVLDARDTLARVALARREIDGVEREIAAAERWMADPAAKRLDPFRTAGLRSRFAEWGAIEQELAVLRIGNASASDEDAARNGWLRAGRWKTRALLEGLNVGAPDSDASAAPVLAPEVALIEYVEGIDELYAYCVHAGVTRVADLGARAETVALARRFADLAADRRCSVRDVFDVGAAVYERIVAPVLRLCDAKPQTLVIVPTADLSTVPFESLVISPPNTASSRGFEALRYLIDDYLVVYAPSSPVLARLQQLRDPEKRTKYLVAGNAIYGAEQAHEDGDKVATMRVPTSSLRSLRALPESRFEVVELARLILQRDPEERRAHADALLALQSARSGELRVRDFDLYVGDRAGAELLRGDLAGYTHMYFAVHGVIDARDPRRSGLAFSWNPRDGGFVTLEEIYGMHLDAQSVVLSACATAAGRVLRGEGVQSLAAGFLRAGARSVVASLWSVDDRDAMQVLRRFEAFSLGETPVHPARALRQAKLEFLRSAEDRGAPVHDTERRSRAPWQWAAFIHVGPPPH